MAADREAALGTRDSGLGTITIADALDGALCFGWIDGQRRSLDELSFLQRYSRRRPRSSWSQVNVAKVEADGGQADATGRAGRGDGGAGGRAMGGGVRDVLARLGRSDRYTVILQLLRARTAATRVRTLDRVVAELGAR